MSNPRIPRRGPPTTEGGDGVRIEPTREGSKAVCRWEITKDTSPVDSESFVGTLASLSLNMAGGSGYGRASAYSTAFLDWFATTDVAGNVDGRAELALTRKSTCAKPSPAVTIRYTTKIEVEVTANGPAVARTAAYCTLSGDLSVENKLAAASGSTPGNAITLGPVTITPSVESEGVVKPPAALVSDEVVLKQADGRVIVVSAAWLKAKADGDTGEALAEIRTKLELSIEVKCAFCGKTAKVLY